MMSAARRNAAIALAFAAAAPACVAASAEASAALKRDLTAFDQARINADERELRHMIWSFDRPKRYTDTLVENYLALIERRQRSGLAFLGEVPLKVSYFDDAQAHKMIAFVDVAAVYRHPMDTSGLRAERRRLYAFSEDEGKTWRFNVLDCVKESDLRAFDAGYEGQPAFLPPADQP